ncbi:sulfite exporter TauE/SafE family protein [Arcobacteraceae bacterium]|nr:sulfite exporter TauE/SafE family protein [Arcobacteraceae bacterium]
MTLILVGIIAGFISGFFGVGGGMILVPMLLLYGFDMKSSVAISIMQMVFSSTYGTFLNYKRNKAIIKDGIIIGIGGFIGGLFSGLIIPNVDGQYLKYLFLFIILLAVIRIYLTPIEHTKIVKIHNKYSLVFIGFIVGAIAMSIGVGGSIMLTPILAGYMFYKLKDASSLGLLFVIFSSTGGFISLSTGGHMLFTEGFIVGVASLIGVFFGVKSKQITHIASYKNLILALYIIIIISILFKL